MSAPAGNLSEGELIQQEIRETRLAIERYHQLTTLENRQQRDRLDVIERRLDQLEQRTENLRQEVAGILESKIWKTLVRGGSLIGKVSGKT